MVKISFSTFWTLSARGGVLMFQGTFFLIVFGHFSLGGEGVDQRLNFFRAFFYLCLDLFQREVLGLTQIQTFKELFSA